MNESPSPTKHAIILFSHGSLLCGAGENLRLLAERMQARGDADLVRVGYLNYSDPPFEETFAECAALGATRITIAPYFLVEGFFVKAQLPPKIVAMQAQFPDVEVRVAKAMCRHELLADAVLSSARREHPPGEWRNILKTAPQFCRADAACPLFGGALCPATLTPRPPLPRYERGGVQLEEEARIASAEKHYLHSPSPAARERGPGGEGFRVPRPSPALIERARQLRQTATNAESMLWKLLRGRQLHGLKFRRQHPIGSFIADFFCDDARLIIELDGAVHTETTQRRRDQQREQVLREHHLGILRFPNEQVFNDPESILEIIGAQAMPRLHSAVPRALLIMIHGSPRAASNDDIFAVIEAVRRRAEYSFVQPGFMECNEPDIPAAIELCVESGARQVVAMSYFLHTGKHVADDLPALLEAAQERHPNISFTMSDYLGRDPLIADILRDRVKSI